MFWKKTLNFVGSINDLLTQTHMNITRRIYWMKILKEIRPHEVLNLRNKRITSIISTEIETDTMGLHASFY